MLYLCVVIGNCMSNEGWWWTQIKWLNGSTGEGVKGVRVLVCLNVLPEMDVEVFVVV